MSPIVSFLLFAALFYFMMRFGCGSHAVHGHHHAGQRAMGSAARSKDPVCGMEVGGNSHYAEVYQGHEYRFCSRNCLDKFDAEPQRYTQPESASV